MAREHPCSLDAGDPCRHDRAVNEDVVRSFREVVFDHVLSWCQPAAATPGLASAQLAEILTSLRGLAPAGEVLFFACPKKSTQKKRHPATCRCAVPCASRRGRARQKGFPSPPPSSRILAATLRATSVRACDTRLRRRAVPACCAPRLAFLPTRRMSTENLVHIYGALSAESVSLN